MHPLAPPLPSLQQFPPFTLTSHSQPSPTLVLLTPDLTCSRGILILHMTFQLADEEEEEDDDEDEDDDDDDDGDDEDGAADS